MDMDPQEVANPQIRRGASYYSLFAIRHSPFAAGAFTLVELLVVMVIIVILVGSVLVAGSSLTNKAKSTNTQAMLSIVNQAVQEFAREQKANPTLTSKKQYQVRYGFYPPDELEVFTDKGVPACPPLQPLPESRAPGGGEIVYGLAGQAFPYMTFDAATYRLDRNMFRGPTTSAGDHPEFRDQIAMIAAIELFGDSSAKLLHGIQDRYWATVIDPAKDNAPALFLDRNGNGQWDAAEDQQLRILIDDWGMPITYFAQRDWTSEKEQQGKVCASTNHAKWNEASTEFIRINGAQPIIASYGPDGPEQLTTPQMGEEGLVSLIGDFEAETGDFVHRVDNPLNADNVYADPSLKEKLARGIQE